MKNTDIRIQMFAAGISPDLCHFEINTV